MGDAGDFPTPRRRPPNASRDRSNVETPRKPKKGPAVSMMLIFLSSLASSLGICMNPCSYSADKCPGGDRRDPDSTERPGEGPEVVSDPQLGFVPGRMITEATHMVKLIQAFADEENLEGMVIAADWEKAFDRVSWEYGAPQLDVGCTYGNG